MKRLTLGVFAVLMSTLVFSLSSIPLVQAEGENLIVNPTVESGDTSPNGWSSNMWGGTQATFSYASTEGSNGKALGVIVSDAGAGDAKWYHDQVGVSAGKTYTFSDSYKSSVSTDIIVRYTVGVDTYQYDLLKTVPASSTWTTASANVVVPEGVTHVTIFHVIALAGDLYTDDFSLVETVVEPPAEPPVVPPSGNGNLVLNPSLEVANGDAPALWSSNAWGTNSASFNYANEGSTGSRSGHVAITNYTDGDAKWYHDQVAVTVGETYTFNDKYKATISSEIVVQYTVGTGAYQYEFLGMLPVSGTWSPANFNFTVPSGATHATIFHLIAGVGELWVDDYSIVVATPVEPPVSTSSILNPSVEEANGVNPANWEANSWGNNNAEFSYENDAAHGSKSVKVAVTNYVDGDAKWMHNPVAVADHALFKFTNNYKATAPSETVVQFELGAGTYSYLWLGTNPASASWVQTEYHFEVVHGATKMVIFHVLAQNGELWVDNYALESEQPSYGESTVPNGNLELELSETMPTSWNHNAWGTNTVSFEYLHTYGYNSDHSIKVTVSEYTDGDAKWFHTPVELTPGLNYKISDYYQSNTDSRIVLAITMINGSTQYLELPGAPASAEWTLYEGTFTMPTGGLSVSIFHILSSVGFLNTDSFNITEYNPTPFNRALLTLTFDDGWEENVTTALPLMEQYGFDSNQFYATTFIENSETNSGIQNAQAIEMVRAFEQAGHEIGSHTITHPNLVTLTPEASLYELEESQAYLQSIVDGPVNYFATPYGAYNQSVKDQIMATYTVHRTVDVGFNSKDNFDVSRLKVQNVLSGTTAAQVASWVEQAQQEGTWLILVLHRVAENPGPYDTTPEKFANMLQSIDASGIEVVTISEAVAELAPQV